MGSGSAFGEGEGLGGGGREPLVASPMAFGNYRNIAIRDIDAADVGSAVYIK